MADGETSPRMERRHCMSHTKKGDPLDCPNYRGITLLNTAYKIFSNILYMKLLPYVEDLVGNYQCGFKLGISMIDQIHNLRQIL
jgi:sorting nexin-29